MCTPNHSSLAPPPWLRPHSPILLPCSPRSAARLGTRGFPRARRTPYRSSPNCFHGTTASSARYRGGARRAGGGGRRQSTSATSARDASCAPSRFRHPRRPTPWRSHCKPQPLRRIGAAPGHSPRRRPGARRLLFRPRARELSPHDRLAPGARWRTPPPLLLDG